MKKSDVQVYFHDLQNRYDNMDTDPDVQRVDSQVMAHNALTVLERIIDEGLDDEQKRFEAYHNGYDQGRFDEYADRMGKEQAEKVKGKLERQKNCPYCHAPYKPFISTGREAPLNLDGGGLIYTGVSNVLGNGPITETTLGVINVLKVPNCPFCKRPLNGDADQ